MVVKIKMSNRPMMRPIKFSQKMFRKSLQIRISLLTALTVTWGSNGGVGNFFVVLSLASNIFSPFVASLLTPFTPSDMWACYVNEGLKGLPPSNLNRVKTLVSKQLPFKKVWKVICYSNLNSTIVVISMRKFVSLIPVIIFELFGIWKPTHSADVSPNQKKTTTAKKTCKAFSVDKHISPLLYFAKRVSVKCGLDGGGWRIVDGGWRIEKWGW